MPIDRRRLLAAGALAAAAGPALAEPAPATPSVEQRLIARALENLHPMAFDGRAFEGLPERMMPLDELRKILLARSTSVSVRDAVWRELVIRARRDGPAWVVAAYSSQRNPSGPMGRETT